MEGNKEKDVQRDQVQRERGPRAFGDSTQGTEGGKEAGAGAGGGGAL